MTVAAALFHRPAPPRYRFGRAPQAPTLLMRPKGAPSGVGENRLRHRRWATLSLELAVVCVGIALLAVPGTDTATLRPGRIDTQLAADLAALGVGAQQGGSLAGRRMTYGPTVRLIANAPERPFIDRDVVLGDGESIAAMLVRAGADRSDAVAAEPLLRTAADGRDIAPGTTFAIRLGARFGADMRRLDSADVRPAPDLQLRLVRSGDGLAITRQAIRVDTTPLHVTGEVGGGLYAAARAAGAPADLVQAYLRAIDTALPITDLRAGDRFDIVAERQRAETGASMTGALLLAGLTRADGRHVRLIGWGEGTARRWVDVDGELASDRSLLVPVAGRLTSGYGYRRHPILGFMRFHSGVDYGAAWGMPVYAPTDGVALFAGYKGGYGRYIQLGHADGLATGYGHLSDIAVSPGQRVRRGEVIGHVGSSGLSTGPHLHYEMFQNGVRVDPAAIRSVRQDIMDAQLRARLRARADALLAAAR